MQTPHLAIAVNDSEELCFTHVKPGTADHLGVEIPLVTLGSVGYDEACKRIGHIALGLMKLWYPREMGQHPQLIAPPVKPAQP